MTSNQLQYQLQTNVCGKQGWRAFAPGANSVSTGIDINKLYQGSQSAFSNLLNGYAVSAVPKRASSILALLVIISIFFIVFFLWRIAHYYALLQFNKSYKSRKPKPRLRGAFQGIIKIFALIAYLGLVVSLIYGGANTTRRIQDNFDSAFTAAKAWMVQAQNDDTSFVNALGTIASTNQLSPANQSDILGQQNQAQTVLNNQVNAAINQVQSSQNQVDTWIKNYDNRRYSFTVGSIAILIFLGLLALFSAFGDSQNLLGISIFIFLIFDILFLVLGWFYAAALLLGVDLCNQFEQSLYLVVSQSQFKANFEGLMYYYLYGQVNADVVIQEALGYRYPIPTYIQYIQQFQGFNGYNDAVAAVNSISIALTRVSFQSAYTVVKTQLCCNVLNQIGVLQTAIILAGSFSIAFVVFLFIVVLMLDFGAPQLNFNVVRRQRHRRFLQPIMESKQYFSKEPAEETTQSLDNILNTDSDNDDSRTIGTDSTSYNNSTVENESNFKSIKKDIESMGSIFNKVQKDYGYQNMGQKFGQTWDSVKQLFMNQMREVKYANLQQQANKELDQQSNLHEEQQGLKENKST